MDRSAWLIILQGIGISVQVVNTQIAILTHDAVFATIVGAVTAGFQFIIQHLGNQTVPTAVAKELKEANKELKDVR